MYGMSDPSHPPVSAEELRRHLGQWGLSATLEGAGDVQVTGVTQDSRAVQPGDLFLAWAGAAYDAHAFLPDAERAGAAAALVERYIPEIQIPQLVVSDARKASGILALRVLGQPEAEMFRVAVTGTNGKTTVTFLLRQLLAARGPSGCLGTLGVVGPDGVTWEGTGGLTTPGPVPLARALDRLHQQGTTCVAMEASSHALAQGRLAGLRFHVGVFTNLTQDHLDYHGTMEAYLQAKAHLLDLVLPEGEVIVNVGDPAWTDLPEISVPVRPIWVEGEARGRARIRAVTLRPELSATSVVLGSGGAAFVLREEGAHGVDVHLPLLGGFNVENALAAAAVARAAGLSLEEIAQGLSTCVAPPGRMERTSVTPCPVILDYAHTPDAIARVLETLRPLVEGRLIVVFGAGGDRDRGKRPLMAQAAEEKGDVLVLTSDNPRTEDPQQILDDLEGGLALDTPRHRVENRREAIRLALEMATPRDLVLVAGKGHERGQTVGREVLPFDERDVVASLVADLAGGGR